MKKVFYPAFRFGLALLLLAIAIPLSAQFNPCNFDAGTLTSADGENIVRICIDDPEEPTNINREGFVGGISQYYITNSGGVILDVPAGGPPFDLSGYGARVLTIWSVAYSGDLIGTQLGDNICAAGATECFDLSNGLTIDRNTGEDCNLPCEAEGGMLALTDGGGTQDTICVDDGAESAVAVTLSGDISGDNTTFLITNELGEILNIPGGNGPFDISGAGAGNCIIWHLAFDDGLVGLQVGNTPDDFEGCFDLSNGVSVVRLAGEDCPGFAPDENFVGTFSGAHEVPNPITSTGAGSLTATLSGDELTVTGSFSGLTSDFDFNVNGGAHLHFGLAGRGGPITILLDASVDDDLRGGTFEAEDNTFTLDMEQMAALRARGLYANIHTVDFPPGEIRAQLVPAGADSYTRAFLVGPNEVPSVYSPAIGGVVIERTGNEITVSGGFSGLSAPIDFNAGGGAHIHTGVVGRNGPISVFLELTPEQGDSAAIFPADQNTFTLTDEQVAAMDANGLYVNIHSTNFPGGEIRGQITPMAATSFYADLSGHQARPMPINSAGNGRIQANVDGNTLTVFGSVNDLEGDIILDLMGGAHIHLAIAGRTGPIAFPMTIDLDAGAGNAGVWAPENNTFTLTDEQVEAFLERRYYVNVHSDFSPPGEVRGQVAHLAKGYFGSALSGINAKPNATASEGSGFVLYELNGDLMKASGSFQDLQSEFAEQVNGGSHVHVGDAASTGGIVYELVASLEDERNGIYLGSENTFTTTAEQRQAFVDGTYYFNLHTDDFLPGEIRGQILRDDNRFPDMVTDITVADGDTVRLFEGSSDLAGGSFDPGLDPNGDLQVFTLEISTIEGFPIQLIQRFTIGTDSMLTSTFDAAYDSLIALGAFPGIALPLDYIVYAGDGSVNTPTARRRVVLDLVGGENPICEMGGGTLAFTETEGDTITICAGDGEDDFIDLELTDTLGERGSQYIITDANLNILALPGDESEINLEGAGGGQCIIIHMAFNGTVENLMVDANITDLEGCYTLSNFLYVNRQTGDECSDDGTGECNAMSATLTFPDGSTEMTICADDGVSDETDVVVTGGGGTDTAVIIITDESLDILAIQEVGPVNLEGAEEGICLAWYLSYDDGIEGLEIGENAGELEGCSGLSNPISFIRQTGESCDNNLCDVDGGTLELVGGGDTITICAGDGQSDAFNVTLTDTVGSNFTYLITDANGTILMLQEDQPFDLDGAGEGTCLVWALSFEDGLMGLEVDANANELVGCSDLSNPITVIRQTGDDCEPGLTDGGVVINEISADGSVEFANSGRISVNLDAYFVSNGIETFALDGITTDCGDNQLKPGELSVYDLSDIIAADGGELILLSSATIDAANFVSYAVWGGLATVNTTAASGADLWSSDISVGSITQDFSLQRDVRTENLAYGLATPTICAANEFSVSTGNPTAADRIAAFPNPFNASITLEIEGLRAANTTLSVLDINGRVVATRTLSARNSREAVNTDQLPAGTYVLRLANERGVSTLRVVKR